MKFLPVQWFDSLPSTNTYLRERLAEPRPPASGTVVAAHHQTAGRGRFDRAWVDEPGRDLAFSFLIETRAPLGWLPTLSMAAAVAVADTLAVLDVEPLLKWPNDVLTNGRKICGILSETVAAPHGGGIGAATGEALDNTAVNKVNKVNKVNEVKDPAWRQSDRTFDNRYGAQPESAPSGRELLRAVIVGVGLNVNMDAATAARIPKPATSILVETGRTLPVEPLLTLVLEALEVRVSQWEDGGFPALAAAWLARSSPLGTPLAVEENGRLLAGTLAGYGERGELLLRDDATGAIHIVGAGDATIRPSN